MPFEKINIKMIKKNLHNTAFKTKDWESKTSQKNTSCRMKISFHFAHLISAFCIAKYWSSSYLAQSYLSSVLTKPRYLFSK